MIPAAQNAATLNPVRRPLPAAVDRPTTATSSLSHSCAVLQSVCTRWRHQAIKYSISSSQSFGRSLSRSVSAWWVGAQQDGSMSGGRS